MPSFFARDEEQGAAASILSPGGLCNIDLGFAISIRGCAKTGNFPGPVYDLGARERYVLILP